jgi:hypothetical protein
MSSFHQWSTLANPAIRSAASLAITPQALRVRPAVLPPFSDDTMLILAGSSESWRIEIPTEPVA